MPYSKIPMKDTLREPVFYYFFEEAQAVPLLCRYAGYAEADCFKPLRLFGDGVEQRFGILPAEAGVGDRLAVGAVSGDGLAALDEVAFDHQPLDELFERGVVLAAVHHLARDADLLAELLV